MVVVRASCFSWWRGVANAGKMPALHMQTRMLPQGQRPIKNHPKKDADQSAGEQGF